MIQIRILPHEIILSAQSGENLLSVLRREGLSPNAPCGGQGTCGKCLVTVNGKEEKACSVMLTTDITVQLPHRQDIRVLHDPVCPTAVKPETRLAAAFDISTTTVVGYLLNAETGRQIAAAGIPNPQYPFGADVVSRVRSALDGNQQDLTARIRQGILELIYILCNQAGADPVRIGMISMVGNPAMQQLFLGMSPENLVSIPFHHLLKRSELRSCAEYIPACPNGMLQIVPDISGYVGADTIGCIMAEQLHASKAPTLLVDIGTNGEMVLAHNGRMIACATAAGPALEGANIRFGMSASNGAIDHVWLEDGLLRFSTIGDAPPMRICGSGLLDAVAVLVQTGCLNRRGRIQSTEEKDGQRVVYLTDNIYLTQEDIRQVQLAKGAIRAGIALMIQSMGITVEDVSQCLLAGAFGTYLNPDSACTIGLLPPELAGRIRSVGNSAGKGARLLALYPQLLHKADQIAAETEYLELASMPQFPKTFARAMGF